MSHIHLPDGALPSNIVLYGILLACIMLVVATRKVRAHNLTEYMPRMAFISALLLVVMSIPLGILPVHANLSVLAGVMLGPWLAIYSAFIVNLFLAFVGHGTVAMVGINTVVLAAEMIAGYLFVRLLVRIVSKPWAAGVAVVLTLALTGTSVFWALNGLGVNVESLLHHDHADEHVHLDDHSASQHDHTDEHDHLDDHSQPVWWALPAIIMAFLAPSIIFETILTFLLIALLVRVRPQLVDMRTQGIT